MCSATKEQPSAGHGNGLVATQNQPAWSLAGVVDPELLVLGAAPPRRRPRALAPRLHGRKGSDRPPPFGIGRLLLAAERDDDRAGLAAAEDARGGPGRRAAGRRRRRAARGACRCACRRRSGSRRRRACSSPRDDDARVAAAQARLGGGAVRLHRLDDRPRSTGSRKSCASWASSSSSSASRDARTTGPPSSSWATTSLTVLTGTAKPIPALPPVVADARRRVDADHAAVRVEERPAGVAAVERRVGLDDAVDPTPLGAAAARAARSRCRR